MTIALDQNLGSNSTSSLLTLTVTTGAAAAAGSKIFAFVSWFNTGASMTVSGGSLTWTSLKQFNNGSDRFAIWSADAPAGLASGTVISAVQGSPAAGLLVNLASFTGLATGTAADATNQANSTGASWSSGAATNIAASALAVGGAGNETVTSTTSTPTAGTELADRWETGGAQQGFATGYTIAASVASRAITGSWVGASSTANTGALVVFPAAGFTGPSATPDVPAGHFTPQLNWKAWF